MNQRYESDIGPGGFQTAAFHTHFRVSNLGAEPESECQLFFFNNIISVDQSIRVKLVPHPKRSRSRKCLTSKNQVLVQRSLRLQD